MRVARSGMRVSIHLLSLVLLAAPLLAQTPVPASPPGGIARPGLIESAPLAPPPGVSAAPDAPASATPQAQGAQSAPGVTPAAPLPVPASPAPPAMAQPSPTVPVTPVPPVEVPVQSSPQQAQPVPTVPVPMSPPMAPPVTVQPSAPATGVVNPRATLVPVPGDPANVDDVTLPERPVAILSGMATWSEGYARLAGAVKRMEEALAKAGIRVAGRPLSRFLESDDLGFRYDMMIPVDRAPADRAGLPADIRFGTSPGGRAIRFSHKAPYDEIDGTYEAITAYLDAKGVTVNDSFLEEYVSDLTNPADPSTEINIFVSPQ